ncbi:MAG: stage III sporulation protein AC [Clostridia bacterium]|nr:stage III sporulation protein AC [Clostridia bacterium]MBQ2273746.1 stage III sporulation protein AC [Clostridia bacterium]MBQ5819737.1 stage III sporulation protein AC [Clostridia bacterium]
METELLFQIAAVGIIVAVLNQVLNKSDRSEQALMVTIAGLVIVLFLIVNKIGELFDTLRAVFGL